MSKKDFKKNMIVVVFLIAYNFILSIIVSIILLLKQIFKRSSKPIEENKFLDIMNFILYIGPKAFWKKPSGIKIGRSISTFIHYIFYKDEYFLESKKK